MVQLNMLFLNATTFSNFQSPSIKEGQHTSNEVAVPFRVRYSQLKEKKHTQKYAISILDLVINI